MELAKTKVQFYEELEDAFPSPISRTNSVQDITREDKPKDIGTEYLNSGVGGSNKSAGDYGSKTRTK